MRSRSRFRTESSPSHFKGADRPVECVSWDDCQTFIEKVNAQGNVRVSLPTEAQWEYACRADCDGTHPYGTTVSGLYRKATKRVGAYAPNAWGLCDMHGNVWEWCADWYGENYYRHSPESDPAGPASGPFHVLRGGGWGSNAQQCRSASRDGNGPSYTSNSLGFRLVCSTGPRR